MGVEWPSRSAKFIADSSYDQTDILFLTAITYPVFLLPLFVLTRKLKIELSLAILFNHILFLLQHDVPQCTDFITNKNY